MSESDNELMMMMEPGFYTNVYGIALGTAESMCVEGCSHNQVAFIFLDANGDKHPFLIDPNSSVLSYLMSDEFRENLSEELAKIT